LKQVAKNFMLITDEVSSMKLLYDFLTSLTETVNQNKSVS
jgi:hypothetical protein